MLDNPSRRERTRAFFLIMHEENILHKNLLINKIKLKNCIQVFTHGHCISYQEPKIHTGGKTKFSTILKTQASFEKGGENIMKAQEMNDPKENSVQTK